MTAFGAQKTVILKVGGGGGGQTGHADTADKLATPRTISATGDAEWSVSFDGSADATAALTLAPSGAVAGTYKSVTVNAKGLVTGGTNPTTLAGYGITDAATADDLDAKVDKVSGKDLSTNDYTTADKNKLAGIAAGANAYTHPANHPASIIEQDADNRFVSDAEKAAWGAKQDALVSGTNIKTINGESLLGAGNIFVGVDKKVGTIGIAGQQGFGVGIYPDALPDGFSALEGTSDRASANYGNYTYSDGSVMVFVPRFYYRIGHTSSPNYAIYGLNAIDIAGVDTFQTEAEANAAGYAMHRAFVDGGAVKHGFFFDKYICSQSEDGVSHGRSVRYGVPISLTTDNGYANSANLAGCTGILADAVTLSRARGVGVFNCASIFMFDALAKLSLAHGQAATSATACAWFDPARTTNFPKGCNNNLADVDDPSVTYLSAGDTGDAMKPRTGTASNLAKTAHNGQECGVVDVNGGMYQTVLGLTQAGSGPAAVWQVTSGDAYVLKPSAKLADLTAGWGGATDAWGTGANLASRYDLLPGFLPWGADTEWIHLGSGSAQVFSPALSGAGYLRSCTGVANLAGYSAAGINAFGVDGCYRYTRENMFPLASGAWNYGSLAGAFFRNWVNFRSNGGVNIGFRAGAYGS